MLVELRGITKRFPGITANEAVDLSVQSGEVLALLGENGAGKSTLMNVLYGLYHADEGEIRIDGEPVRFASPADALAAGIGMVHQHFMLVPPFSVVENLMLGNEVVHGPLGRLDLEASRERIVELSKRYGLAVDPDAIVESLPVGVQQRAEILKALYRDADLLILDEPTAVLTPAEITELEGVIASLAAAGKAVILITHKLAEVMRVADRIAVLRRGRVVGETTPGGTDEQALAEMMVGRAVKLVVDKDPPRPAEVMLSVRGLSVLDDRGAVAVDELDFEVRRGEILAVAGVQGNGQTELVEAICGLRPPLTGTVTLDGTDVTGSPPGELFRSGLGHVPEDRQNDGLVGAFSVADNMVLNTFDWDTFSSGPLRDRNAVQRNAETLTSEFDVRTPTVSTPAGTLSGGNQQKVIVAREFTHSRNLLVAAQPTRGLDVGSIQYIHARIVASRDEGAAVLVVSAELDEVLALADRVAVMSEGRFVGVLEGDQIDRNTVGLLMAGHRSTREPASREATDREPTSGEATDGQATEPESGEAP
ncbi:MAG: ABC transporter ATP-binding protein [Microthrixaceae bacterium]